MSKPIPNYLKLVAGPVPPTQPADEDLSPLLAICQAFEPVTGCTLHYSGVAGAVDTSRTSTLLWSAPANPGVGATPGHIRLFSDPLSSASHKSSESMVAQRPSPRPLAEAIVGLWDELSRTRRALWAREAELAAGVPLSSNSADLEQLAARLEAVLRGGGQAVGADAAALYLLDEGTSQLKLRACWGLPKSRLLSRARPLRGALGDLEAMLGHAVVLESRELMAAWPVPEPCGAAVCVPVFNSSEPLGTLWVFSRGERAFDDNQTGMLEIVAGRIAAELEREMLWASTHAARRLDRQVAAAAEQQRGQSPTVAPLIEGWQVAGRLQLAGELGGAFYDWFAQPNGDLNAVLGSALRSGFEGTLPACTLRAGLRCAGDLFNAEAVHRLESLMASSSSSGELAGLAAFGLTPGRGEVRALVARPARMVTTAGLDCSSQIIAEPLGALTSTGRESFRMSLAHGEAMVAFTVAPELEAAAMDAAETSLSEMLTTSAGESAEQLAQRAIDLIAAAVDEAGDVAVLVLRRTDGKR